MLIKWLIHLELTQLSEFACYPNQKLINYDSHDTKCNSVVSYFFYLVCYIKTVGKDRQVSISAVNQFHKMVTLFEFALFEVENWNIFCGKYCNWFRLDGNRQWQFKKYFRMYLNITVKHKKYNLNLPIYYRFIQFNSYCFMLWSCLFHWIASDFCSYIIICLFLFEIVLLSSDEIFSPFCT